MNGLTLLVLIAFAIGIVIAYRAGVMRGVRSGRVATPWRPAATAAPPVTTESPVTAEPPVATEPPVAPVVPPLATPNEVTRPSPTPAAPTSPRLPDVDAERARLIRSLEGETAVMRRALSTLAAERDHLASLAEDRRRLQRELADARGEAARYRALVVDLENNALPPLLGGPNAPDDLKLIVGIGPVLERMLHQLGITTYRQIARWSERDIDEFDARLPEFPGRIRRDTWVVQARALHQAKFGETIPPRDR